MKRNTQRKGQYKTTSKKGSTHRTRKQSGRGINFNKLKLVINNRSRASKLANISSKKAQELKEHIESV